MLRKLAIGTLFLASAATVANADVFRWVDEHGSVHYSDQWVPGSELIKTTKPHPSNSSSSPAPTHTVTDAPKITSASNQIAQDSATRAVKQDVAKAREQQCKDAKERYDKAIQARRIYKSGDKSNPDDRQYLSDEEADAFRLQARKEVQSLCGDSALKTSAE
jgi:Domain of unknown function (DUF4124)